MRILIVDDQKKVRGSIRGHIETHYPAVTLILEASNISSAMEIIESESPEVVLLDIRMPDGTGFDLLKKLMPLNFKVIFITAYEEYAVQGFKYSALDYLLKPVDAMELVNALQKASYQIQQDELNRKLSNFMQNLNEAKREAKKIVIKSKDSIRVISINEIIRCEADDSYTKFFLAGNKTILSSETLKNYDDILKDSGFFRSHHSHLLNTAHIVSFEKSKSMVITSDGHKVPVSVRRKEQLLQLLEKI
jgi:two-component system, LytTR family, response regulator